MNTQLPTAHDLEKLPLRAIAAYAARVAHRISTQLCGTIADEVIDNAIERVDAIWRSRNAGETEVASLMRAVGELYGAIMGVEDPTKHLIVIGISQSAQVAIELVNAERNPARVAFYLSRAAKKAESAVSAIDDLHVGAFEEKLAANHDFEVLLSSYGAHEQAIIGEPIDCFANETGNT